jgi:hypothetical protein
MAWQVELTASTALQLWYGNMQTSIVEGLPLDTTDKLGYNFMHYACLEGNMDVSSHPHTPTPNSPTPTYLLSNLCLFTLIASLPENSAEFSQPNFHMLSENECQKSSRKTFLLKLYMAGGENACRKQRWYRHGISKPSKYPPTSLGCTPVLACIQMTTKHARARANTHVHTHSLTKI